VYEYVRDDEELDNALAIIKRMPVLTLFDVLI